MTPLILINCISSYSERVSIGGSDLSVSDRSVSEHGL